MVGLVGVGVAIGTYSQVRAEQQKLSIANYDLEYATFIDWKSIPHSPYLLFTFKHPSADIRLMGGTNQIVSESNPTPEMDTDGIAKHYLEVTKSNFKGWKASELQDAMGPDLRFSMIRRESGARAVINCFAVRGNTTVLVSLTASNEAIPLIDAFMPQVREYLASMKLVPTKRADLQVN
jgi:hypothetical protein